MTCSQWFWAEDEDGDFPPFGVEFVLKKRVSGEWEIVDTYSIPRRGLSLTLDAGGRYEAVPLLDVAYEDDWERPDDVAFTACEKDVTFVYKRIVVEVPELVLSGIETIRRYGGKFYLKGNIRNIRTTDELCLMYSRPGSADLLNLPSDTTEYLYLKGTSGTYDLEGGGRYIEFSTSGYYIFQLWRVSGDCETRTEKVAEYILSLTATKYQYQLYFDTDDAEIVDYRHLLVAEYEKYHAARPWTIVPDGRDCFARLQPSTLYAGGTFASGWLCQAAEFLASGCAPLPWWMCRSLTEWDVYWRGECSCSNFLENLQPLGIPCFHLIAARVHYGRNPPYCPYIQCD